MLYLLKKWSILEKSIYQEVVVMKDTTHRSDITHSEKTSPLAYALSVIFIGISVFAIASIMGCSLPY